MTMRVDANIRERPDTEIRNAVEVQTGHNTTEVDDKGEGIRSHADECNASNEMPVEEAFSGVMTGAWMVGLHVCVRGNDGSYVVRTWRLAPVLLLGLGSVVTLILMVSSVILYPMPYWYMVTSFPNVFAHIFCLFTYVQTLVNVRCMSGYLSSLRPLTVKRTLCSRLAMLATVPNPIVLVALCLFFLPWAEMVFALPAICVTSFIPAVLDVYMGAFLTAMSLGFGKVVTEVRTRVSWTIIDVHQVFAQWLRLTKVLATHNEIFCLTLHLRLLLLVMETLSFAFVLWAFRTHRGECGTLLLFTLLLLVEVVVRLHTLCMAGQNLAAADEDLVRALTEAAYRVPTASQEQEALTILVARLETRPSRVRIWGTESLTARTQVQLCGLVVTCLVVVLQLSPDHQWIWATEESVTRFDHCFLDNSTTF